MTIEEAILKIIDEEEAVGVKEVIGLLKFTEEEILEAIKRLEGEEKIELNHNIPTCYSFTQYLKNADYNLWLYLVFLSSLGALLIIHLTSAIYPLIIARWILGSLFILFLPGYALIEALFPKRGSLDVVERLALSTGLSIAITPLIGLLLNYTPWGIRLDSIAISLITFVLTVSLLATYRKFTLGKNLHIRYSTASKRA